MRVKRKWKKPMRATRETSPRRIPSRILRQNTKPKTTQRKPNATAPTSTHVLQLDPMPSGRLEDFCFRLFFSMLLITFDFFYAVAEPVWMESVSVASKVRDSLTTRFLRKIRFVRKAQGRFPAKPPAGSILHERKARKYLCYCNRFIRSIPVLRRLAKR